MNEDKRQLSAIVDFENDRVKEARKRQSAALAIDAVTNLVSMYARGTRYPVGTNFASQHTNRLLDARENAARARRNYNTLVTELAFRNIIDNGHKAATGSPVARFTVPKEQKPLSLGTGASLFAKNNRTKLMSTETNLRRLNSTFKK